MGLFSDLENDVGRGDGEMGDPGSAMVWGCRVAGRTKYCLVLSCLFGVEKACKQMLGGLLLCL